MLSSRYVLSCRVRGFERAGGRLDDRVESKVQAGR
jgi:hypothetical protein